MHNFNFIQLKSKDRQNLGIQHSKINVRRAQALIELQ